MCGLFGFRCKREVEPAKKVILTRALGWKSEARGFDAWGIYAQCSKVDKETNAVEEYTRLTKNTDRFNHGWRNTKQLRHDAFHANWLMGHTRWGTHGANTKSNAHPFELGRFVMAHNGVIATKKYKEEALYVPNGDTDSETFLAWVVGGGYGITAFLDVESYNDAFEVYVKDEDKLFLVTSGKELSIIETDDIIVWSSDRDITETSYQTAFREKIDSKKTEENAIYEIKPTGVELFKKIKKTRNFQNFTTVPRLPKAKGGQYQFNEDYCGG